MGKLVNKVKNVLTAPFRWLKQTFISLQFKIAGLFLKKTLKKQTQEKGGMPATGGQDIESMKTMVMEFARKTYAGVSKNKDVIITLNGQFKVDDVKIAPDLLNDPKELRKAIKQAVGDALQKILGAMMGLTGGSVPSIPGFPGM